MYRYVILILAVFSMSVSCAEKAEAGAGDDSGLPIPETNVEIDFKADRNTVLRNPMNGWVMYLFSGSDESYFDKTVYVPSQGKDVLVRDYASACYIRTSWSSLNPEEGIYTWRQPDTGIYRLLEAARKHGLPVAFRIVVDGREQGPNTPDFVFEDGAEYYLSDPDYPDRRTPFPIDPVFRKHYEIFVEELAKDFNDPDRIAFIDGYGLGRWGEGHNVVYEPGGKPTEKTVDYANETMEWVTSLYSRFFTKVPLVINYHRHIGYTVSEGREPSPDSDRRMQIAIDNGYCVRSDAFGMNSVNFGYGSWERAFALRCNAEKIPIVMEGGWIVSKHEYWNDPLKYRQGHPEDVRKGEFDGAMEARVNMMDFRNGNETESWFRDAFSYIQRFVSEGGYRLYPDKVSVPVHAGIGDDVTVTSTWVNLGWGFCPTNLRQWNQKYKVAFALLDIETGEPVKVFTDVQTDLSAWMKGSPTSYTFDISLKGVPAGAYQWAVGLVDISGKEPQIGIRMAVDRNVLTPEGWARIAHLELE